MGTWVGAIIENPGGDLTGIAAKHGLSIERVDDGPYVLLESDVGLGSLFPPTFAEQLSRDVNGAVVAFFVQTTASVEEIEHWEHGKRLRKLSYSADEGGWLETSGVPQPWEPDYFFEDGHGTDEGERWPLNLGDELTDEDIARYREARDAGDASSIMDLLHGGSVWPLHRLCAHFGVNPEQPAVRYAAPRSKRPWLILAAVIAFFIGMFLLGSVG